MVKGLFYCFFIQRLKSMFKQYHWLKVINLAGRAISTLFFFEYVRLIKNKNKYSINILPLTIFCFSRKKKKFIHEQLPSRWKIRSSSMSNYMDFRQIFIPSFFKVARFWLLNKLCCHDITCSLFNFFEDNFLFLIKA